MNLSFFQFINYDKAFKVRRVYFFNMGIGYTVYCISNTKLLNVKLGAVFNIENW